MSLPLIPLRVDVPRPPAPDRLPTPGEPPYDPETANQAWQQAPVGITAQGAQDFVQRLWGQYAFGIDDNLQLVTSSIIQNVLEELFASIQPAIRASTDKGARNAFVTADKVPTYMLQWMKNLNLPYEEGVAKWGIRVERTATFVSETTRLQTANEAYLTLRTAALELHPIVYACAFPPNANAAIYLVHLGESAFDVANNVTANDADRINQMQLRLPTLFWKAASSRLIMLDCKMENLVWIDDAPIFIDMDPKYTTFAPDLDVNCIFYINAILYLALELCLSIVLASANDAIRPGFYLNYSLLQDVASMHKRGFADSICQALGTFNLTMTNIESLPTLQPGETHDLNVIAKAAFAQATLRCKQFKSELSTLKDHTFPFWGYLGALISHVADTMPPIDTLGTTPLPPMEVPNRYALIPPPDPPKAEPKELDKPKPDRNPDRNRSRDANNESDKTDRENKLSRLA
jgi:hypothetical protein